MKWELARKVLQGLVDKHEGVRGNEHYWLLKHGFYDFEEKMCLNRGEYEELILSMAEEGLIGIEYNGGVAYERAIIVAENKGLAILIQKEEMTK